MTGKHVFVLTAALALALAFGPAGCGGKGDEPSGSRQGAVSKNKIKGAPGFMKRVLKKAPRPRLPDGGVAPARGASAPTPPELIGLWEKTDLPGRGMRIEFAPKGGLVEVKVESAPVSDAASAAFFLQKADGKKDRAGKNEECFLKAWTVGAVKYARLKPSGPSQWSGAELVPVFIAALRDCSKGSRQQVVVDLKLEGKDRLVATAPADEAAKAPATPTAIWERVVEESASEKPVEKEAFEKKARKK